MNSASPSTTSLITSDSTDIWKAYPEGLPGNGGWYAVIGCGDLFAFQDALRDIKMVTSADWLYYLSFVGSSRAFTKGIAGTDIDWSEAAYKQIAAVEAAKRRQFDGVIEVQHIGCAGYRFHEGDLPLETQRLTLLSTLAETRRISEARRPNLARFGLIYDPKEGTWNTP